MRARRAATPADADFSRSTGRNRAKDNGNVYKPSASGAIARFLDQRLELCDALLEIAIVAGIRPTGKRGNAHACALDTVTLL